MSCPFSSLSYTETTNPQWLVVSLVFPSVSWDSGLDFRGAGLLLAPRIHQPATSCASNAVPMNFVFSA